MRQNLPGADALVDALRLAARAPLQVPTLSFPPAPPSASSSSCTEFSPPQPVSLALAFPPSPSDSTSSLRALLLGLPHSPPLTDSHHNPSTQPHLTDISGPALSNPLGLLSDVCADAAPLPPPRRRGGGSDEATLSLEDIGVGAEEATRYSEGIDWFADAGDEVISDGRADYFKCVPIARLEIDEDGFDPIELGIVTEQEVIELFDL